MRPKAVQLIAQSGNGAVKMGKSLRGIMKVAAESTKVFNEAVIFRPLSLWSKNAACCFVLEIYFNRFHSGHITLILESISKYIDNNFQKLSRESSVLSINQIFSLPYLYYFHQLYLFLEISSPFRENFNFVIEMNENWLYLSNKLIHY